MTVSQPGAAAAGTAVDRLAVTLRRIAGAAAQPVGASLVIYFEEDDGTTTEITPDPEPMGGLDG